MAKIVVDILGGDNAPHAMLDGVAMAAARDTSLEFVLVGDEAVIAPFIATKGLTNRCEVIHSTDTISNEESPTAVKSRTGSSIHIGMKQLKEREDVMAFVGAGSTGATLAGGVLLVGRLPGVLRPALCPLFPTVKEGQQVMVIDAGANVDSKPEYLFQFAVMGTEFMKSRGVENPRVALVNVGTEDKKGNELTAATFKLLKQSNLNFVGNMECKDAFSGNYDVLVCDGFVGNVLLKTAEGAMKMTNTLIKRKLKTSGFKTKLGALMVRKSLSKLKSEIGDEAVGGSVFIGAKKPIVKAHGSSNAVAFSNAIMVAKNAGMADIGSSITAALSNTSIATENQNSEGEKVTATAE